MIIKYFKKNCKKSKPLSVDVSKETNKGRNEIRKVEIYNNLNNINKEDWVWIKTLIKVFRKVEHKWITRKETSYYISSVWCEQMNAKEFNYWIRSHWGIENTLHYSKDVTFREDYSKIITKNAPQNMSLIRNMA